MTAAIELMRTAQPMDEKAEREHCAEVSHKMRTMVHDAEELMRERAAARAEGYAQCLAQCDRLADEQQAKLSAAQGKIERLLKAFQAEQKIANTFETKLTNLRTAADRYLQDEAYGVTGLPEFLAAIEASR